MFGSMLGRLGAQRIYRERRRTTRSLKGCFRTPVPMVIMETVVHSMLRRLASTLPCLLGIHPRHGSKDRRCRGSERRLDTGPEGIPDAAGGSGKTNPNPPRRGSCAAWSGSAGDSDRRQRPTAGPGGESLPPASTRSAGVRRGSESPWQAEPYSSRATAIGPSSSAQATCCEKQKPVAQETWLNYIYNLLG